jgi:signal peptidase
LIKKIYNFFSTIFLILIVIIAIALVLPHLLKYKTYAVISGSMEPTLHVGSLAYVRSSLPEEIEEGDIITFLISQDSSLVATHRVVSINLNDSYFITKGDANESEDAPIQFNKLIGRTLFSIPYLGYLTVFLKTKQGIVLTIFILTLTILFSIIPPIIKREKCQSENNS